MARDGESLSLAETNKIRVSLGLAPLADDDGAGESDGAGEHQEPDSDDPDAKAEANYAARRAEEQAARLEKETKERLAKAKNQRELRAKLQGKSLGDADEAGSSKASDWVKQSRKREKQRAAELEKLRQRERELDERDREATYGEDDLAGLKVAHGADDFEEGRDVILTLADKRVLDDDDDELQNVNLAEYARTAERLDLKKRGKNAYKYTGLDDEEFGGDPSSKARGVLSKYDEELEGRRGDDGFRLGGAATSAEAGPSSSRRTTQEQQRELNRDLLSLDYTKTEQNDYLQEGDVGFKKAKKKKKSGKSSRRTAAADEEDVTVDANGDVDMAAEPAIPTAERRLAKEGGRADAVIDDEDLQAALARQRRAAGKKRIQIMKGEDLARQIIEEKRAGSMALDSPGPDGVKTEEGDDASRLDGEEEGGLVLDETSEFIRNISARPLIAKRENGREKGTATPTARVKAEPRDDDIPLDELATQVKEEEPEEGEALDEYNDTMAVDQPEEQEEDVKPTTEKGKSAEPEDKFGGTADEKFVSGGMASTLALLKQSGLVKPLTPEEIERERKMKEQERFIAEMRLRDAQRDMERQRARASANANASGSGPKNAQAERAQREYENKRAQFEYAQKQMESFKNYKPNVDIKYHDEFGRELSQKEAWKDLSHKFHGKGSGVNKREKLLKRIEEERKREAMASGDTPLSANAAFQARQERMGSATMVIGVGNRNAAPSAETLLGPAKPGVAIAKRPGAPGATGTTTKKKKTEPKVLG